MTTEEFERSFATVTVCMVRKDEETLRLKGEFLKQGRGEVRTVIDRGVRSKY